MEAGIGKLTLKINTFTTLLVEIEDDMTELIK
jgi:hypothetical protein